MQQTEILRTALIRAVDAVPPGGVIQVSAPRGYGKTVLLRQYRAWRRAQDGSDPADVVVDADQVSRDEVIAAVEAHHRAPLTHRLIIVARRAEPGTASQCWGQRPGLTLGRTDLAFTPDEIAELARHYAVDPARLALLGAQLGGWPAAMAAAAAALGRGAPGQPAVTALIDACIEEVDAPRRSCLLMLALVGRAPIDLVVRLSTAGDPAAERACGAWLTRQESPLVVPVPDRPGLVRLIPAARERLVAQLPDPTGKASALAAQLAEIGLHQAGFEALRTVRNQAGIASYVADHGATLALTGRTDVLQSWLRDLMAGPSLGNPRLLRLAQLVALVEGRGETAHRIGLRLAGERRSRHRDDVALAVAAFDCLDLLTPLPETPPTVAGSVEVLFALVRAIGLVVRGDLGPAAEILRDLRALTRDMPLVDTLRQAVLAETTLRLGSLEQGGAAVDQALAAVRDRGLEGNRLTVLVDLAAALRASLVGDEAGFRAHQERAAATLAGIEHGMRTVRCRGYLTLGETALSLGLTALARDMLRAAGALADDALPVQVVQGLRQLRAALSEQAPAAKAPVTTSTERAVLELLCSHLSVPDIAAQLGVSTATVRTHVRSLYTKYRVHSRSELVQKATATT